MKNISDNNTDCECLKKPFGSYFGEDCGIPDIVYHNHRNGISIHLLFCKDKMINEKIILELTLFSYIQKKKKAQKINSWDYC